MTRLVILFPVFNGGKWLHESIRAIASQTYTDYKVIAVDDCSTDDSWGILSQTAKNDPLHWHVFRNPANLGMTRNWNACVRKQRELFPAAAYIIKIDCDDVPSPGLLKRGVESLDAEPMASLCTFRQMKIVDDVRYPVNNNVINYLAQKGWSPDKSRIMPQRELLYCLIRFDNFMASSGTMFRSYQFQKLTLPFYDIRFKWAPDYDLWARLSLAGCMMYVAEAYIEYRILAGSITGQTGSAVKYREALSIGVESYFRGIPKLGIGKICSLMPVTVYKILLLFKQILHAKNILW